MIVNSKLKTLKLCLLILFGSGCLYFTTPVLSWSSHAQSINKSGGKDAGQGEANPQVQAVETTKAAKKEVIENTGGIPPAGGSAVAGAPAPGPDGWSFRNHVLAVMTKTGCNSGACHGAAAGKNGFKLTLRGYDPELDYAVLTRQAAARRISTLEPEKSLLLLKPTMVIAHGGGKRFDVNSLEYKVISEWIAAGAPPPSDEDPVIERIEITPGNKVLALNQEQRLTVRAKFSDGRIEDVSRWVKYTSSDEGIATVGEDGLVKMIGHGEATVSVWYLSRVASARVSVPFPNKIDPNVFARAARTNFVDELVLKKIKMLNIAPSGAATDAEFIRRAYLDATGALPTPDEVRRFLADTSPGKRSALVDALLERPEYVDYWAYKWSDLLLVSSNKLQRKTLLSFNNWIREGVRANKPWDQFARELVTSSGNSQENGAVGFYIIHKNPIDRAENMTAAFLGIRMTCARCHNHPLEKWTQKEYYGFANLFSRVKLKNGAGPGDVTVFADVSGDINHPRLNRPLPPRPLDGEDLALDSSKDRRLHFAEWLTSPQNPYFARMVINRVWKNFMGRGLVEPVDDMRATNPASNDELLVALEADFIKHGFDLKHLIRTIMNSATYGLSSEMNSTNAKDDRFYSHYIARRLPAEVILDAMSQVTNVPTKFDGYPVGTRALQLPDSRVDSYFLTVFGRPERLITAESERQQDPSLTQALHIINGKTVNEKIKSPEGIIDKCVKENLSEEKVVEVLYLSALSRYPTIEEKRGLTQVLARESGEARKQALEDIVWALLTGREFLFNH